MQKHLCLLFVICIASFCAFAGNTVDPLNAVIRIDAITYQPNYFIPWQNKMQDGCSGSGVVISGNRILTNAHNVTDATYITVTKQNADENYQAKVLAVNHDCDLALLEVEDKSFFMDIHPLEIGQTPPPQSQVAVAGFPIGGDGLSITQGVISRIEVHSYVHSWYNLLAAQLDAAVNPGNSGGPVLYNGQIVGIAFQGNSGGEGLGYMIPTDIIRHFLKDIEDGHVDGFGFVGFRFGTLENPATRRYLKMKDGQTGVRIIHVSPANRELLKTDDVLLAMDGVKIANNGNIRLMGGEARLFTTLVHQKQIGEKINLSILRNGQEISLDMPVRKIYNKCHERLYDTLPDYYITGGFVFTTLSHSFLDEWGRKDPPSDLTDLISQEKEYEDEEVVVLSLVLGDKVNVGYQGLMSQRLKSVNGKPVRNLKEFVRIVETNQEEFITFTFGEGEYPVTLDLKELRASTPKILERYRVPADRSKSLQ